MIHNNEDWREWIEEQRTHAYFNDLMKKLEVEDRNFVIYPIKENRLKMIEDVDFDKIKVIILNDYPYCHPNQADGFALSSEYDLTTELNNVFRKIEHDTRIKCLRDEVDLYRWHKQGVYLINHVCTARANKKISHKNIGWEILTNKIIERLFEDERPKVFFFMGCEPRRLRFYLKEKYPKNNHLILISDTPDKRMFFKGEYFNHINNFLLKEYGKEIDWR